MAQTSQGGIVRRPAGIVQRLAPLIYRAQRSRKRQIVISTHSYDLLRDKGIDASEVLILIPDTEGTTVQLAEAVSDVKELLSGGMSIGDAVLPLTNPRTSHQLSMFE